MKNPEYLRRLSVEQQTRRFFLKTSMACIGGMALQSLLPSAASNATHGTINPHHAAKAKRVIYIHLAGAPSHLETFDFKPELSKLDGKPCPESFLKGKRFAFIKGVPNMLGPQYKFSQHGQSGAYVAEHLPELSKHVDDICFIKSMWTEQFNHAPAQLMLQTGSQLKGRPCVGSWAYYGLGTENQDLPGFLVLTSGGKNPDAGKSVWGSGFLPSIYQGVQCHGHGEPILFAKDPDGVTRDERRATIDALNELNQRTAQEYGDPETLTRIGQYEMAFRMQMSVPEATDIGRETDQTREAYGAEPGKNSFANNCLLARRLCERGVRFIQLYDWGWDAHGDIESNALNGGVIQKLRAMDKAVAALLGDLKQRGLLKDTLVVCGAEFGRTPMQENRERGGNAYAGRDHNPGGFTVWMAGGGVKGGLSFGETDEFGYQAVVDKVHVHDLNATIMHLLGFNHEKLTFFFQGRHYRLTDVHGALVKPILA
ncbi:MAG TPA: DUF1501 domain-containing protein [Methylomirabilota bacterium]|nr:DUF1501 domain-containing protein [Methylomirabilota bacterium]